MIPTNQKKHIHFSIMNKSIVIVLLTLFFSSCGEAIKPKTEFEKLEQFCSVKGLVKSLADYYLVVIINDDGNCLNCNNIFADKMSDRINDENVLFILSEDGTKVDISAYIDSQSENVIWDINGDFDKLNLVESCSLFELENNKIVDKTAIDATNINTFEWNISSLATVK